MKKSYSKIASKFIRNILKQTLMLVLLTIFSIGIISCNSIRPNGWYHITDGAKDSVSSKPIVTVSDFETLRLDSSANLQRGEVIYQISGTMNESASKKWADATEKAIGERIGFIYNNEVICDPYINCRIESGSFAISTNKGYDIKKLFEKLKQ